MGRLQAYDHSLTLTSASEETGNATNMGVGPANWPGPHPSVEERSPSASQHRVGGQNSGHLLARGRVRTLVQDRDAGGDDAAVNGG